MGMDFDCGCRCSFGNWFLCEKHEAELISKLESNMDKKKLEDSRSNIELHRRWAKLHTFKIFVKKKRCE